MFRGADLSYGWKGDVKRAELGDFRLVLEKIAEKTCRNRSVAFISKTEEPFFIKPIRQHFTRELLTKYRVRESTKGKSVLKTAVNRLKNQF